ncbi:MAG: glycosyltransferase family 25 protein [Roseiarcus sp.]
MRSLIINLARSQERRMFVENHFRQHGLAFEIVPALDGLSDPLPQDARWTYFRRTEIGCFLSHRRCWERIADGTDQFSAVFEDDAILAPNASKVLDAIPVCHASMDLIKLETFLGPVQLSRRAFSLDNSHVVRRLFSFHLGAAGYVLSRRGARIQLELMDKCLLEPVDTFLFSPQFPLFRKIAIGQVIPAICIQSRFRDEGRFPATISYDEDIERRTSRANRIYRELRKFGDQLAKWFDRNGRETLTVPFAEV